MLRIAIQAKGRLNEQSIDLLSEAGIGVAESKRKLISRADGFPMEVLYLRDDPVGRGVFQFHPRPLLRVVNFGKHADADARMDAEVRLPDHDDLAVGIFDTFLFGFHNNNILLKTA